MSFNPELIFRDFCLARIQEGGIILIRLCAIFLTIKEEREYFGY